MKSQVFNPFLPIDVYIPDGEPHVFGDRVYLFGSHDKEDGDTFCMMDYEIWSAPVSNLSEWSSKGVNYTVKQDKLYNATMKYMYAPDCVKGNDGRYYLYYCLAGYRGNGGYSGPISVAVSDTPDGKYEYFGVVKYPDGTPFLRYVCFDPAVMNDGGVVRLYYGTTLPWLDSIPFKNVRYKSIARIVGRDLEDVKNDRGDILGAYHVVLADDMLTVISKPVRIDTQIRGKEYKHHKFFEGSSIRKIGDTYYFIYSSANNHELCYATSYFPDKDFQYGGTIISNGDIGYQGREPKNRLNHTGTNHGSIEQIDGKWYVFYHRLTHNSDYSRQACAEPITVSPEGNISQVEMTSCGLNNGPLIEGSYPAVICCNLTNGKMRHGTNSKSSQKEPCITNLKGERFITGIVNGTVIGFKYFTLSEQSEISIKTRGRGNGYFEVLTSFDGPVIMKIPIRSSKDWKQHKETLTKRLVNEPIYLRYIGKGKQELITFSIISIQKQMEE